MSDSKIDPGSKNQDLWRLCGRKVLREGFPLSSTFKAVQCIYLPVHGGRLFHMFCPKSD